MKKKVIWDELPRNALKEASHYIQRNSIHEAEKVKNGIIAATKELSEYPERYPPDKYRKDNDIRFRAFEKFNYRISYFIAEDAIRILRFRHVR